MWIKKYYILLLTILMGLLNKQAKAQTNINPDSIRNKMQWFANAKLGIFIHLGIYAVNGLGKAMCLQSSKLVLPATFSLMYVSAKTMASFVSSIRSNFSVGYFSNCL